MDHLCGIYLGTVQDNKDPENMLRLRVRIPMVLGDAVSDWALPCLPTHWRDGVVKAHSDHTFTDTNNGMGASGNAAVTLTHDHNHELLEKVPPLGTNVWIMFVGGDPDYPVWLGTL